MRPFPLVSATLLASLVSLNADAAEDSAPLIVRVYPVADLVAQPSDVSETATAQLLLLQQLGASADALNNAVGKESREEATIGRNLDELADLLQTTTFPGDWETLGGEGRIATYRKTLSLVVRQTEQGHAEISDLLQMLRHENSLRVEVTIEYFEENTQVACQPPCPQPYPGVAIDSPYATYVPSSGAAQPALVAQASTAVTQTPSAIQPASVAYPDATVQPAAAIPGQPVQAPPVGAVTVTPGVAPAVADLAVRCEAAPPKETLAEVIEELAARHGRTMNEAELKEFRERMQKVARTQLLQRSTQQNGRSGVAGPLVTSAIVSPDRRFVDVNVSMPSEIGIVNGGVRIPDGESATLHIAESEGDGSGITLLVSAKIQTVEEEEELILE